MTDEKKKNNRIEKLIRFLKSYASGKPVPREPDYTSWNQTEAEYQRQQAEWMASVKQRKRKKKQKSKSASGKSQK